MQNIPSCPHCGHARFWHLRRQHRKCKKCLREWSPRSQFPVADMRLTERQWETLIAAFLRDGRAWAVARECGIAYATAQKAVSLLRCLMACDAPAWFSGVCEADETYVGGAWKNKPASIRLLGTKRGRGTSKQGIFGILSRETGTVRLWLIPDSTAATLCGCVAAQVLPGSTIYTDEWQPYEQLPRFGFGHSAVNHRSGEYVRGTVHTQGIEGYWGLLKSHLARIGGIRKRRLPLFLGEHVWRYNHRKLSREERVCKLTELLLDHERVIA